MSAKGEALRELRRLNRVRQKIILQARDDAPTREARQWLTQLGDELKALHDLRETIMDNQQ